jgi:hypothetical protein
MSNKLNLVDVISLSAVVFFVLILIFTMITKPDQKCTDEQLHRIIAEVDNHKLHIGGAYDSDYGKKLIEEICK